LQQSAWNSNSYVFRRWSRRVAPKPESAAGIGSGTSMEMYDLCGHIHPQTLFILVRGITSFVE
ncbi:MAG: hypothetical protein ACKO1U_03555, partial [Bacteroidota bacterium]